MSLLSRRDFALPSMSLILLWLRRFDRPPAQWSGSFSKGGHAQILLSYGAKACTVWKERMDYSKCTVFTVFKIDRDAAHPVYI
jgi:hypothetical protein